VTCVFGDEAVAAHTYLSPTSRGITCVDPDLRRLWVPEPP